MNKFAFMVLLAFTQVSFANEEVIRGTWFENDYEFAMSKEWEDVHGSWGMSRYDLVWDSYSSTLSGNTGGVYQELEFDEVAKYISGESYCGWIDLAYAEDEGVQLIGSYCMNPVNLSFASKAEMLSWVKATLFPHMVAEFPEPAREAVQNFIKTIVNPY